MSAGQKSHKISFGIHRRKSNFLELPGNNSQLIQISFTSYFRIYYYPLYILDHDHNNDYNLQAPFNKPYLIEWSTKIKYFFIQRFK